MSFKKEFIAPGNWQQLMPMAIFNHNSTFGQRVQEKREEKQKVAWYVADKWLSKGRPDAFITDGSSTFYISLAVLAIPRERQAIICTNNLAISTETDAHSDREVRGMLSLKLPGGEKDFDLDATLGTQAEMYAKDFLEKHNIVIASVRELHPELGPTAPETESRCLKKVAMEKASLLIIVADWKKITTPPISNAYRVFPSKGEWENLLRNKEVWIISAMPSDTDDTEDARALLRVDNTCELGQTLKTQQKDKNPEWLKPHEKYALNVFLLSENYHVNFVEVS